MKRIMLLIIAVISLSAASQRRITPVTTGATMTQSRNESKNDSIDRSNLVEMHDSEGRIVLVDTVTGKEFVDSTELKKKKIVNYPLIHSAIVGVDFWNPIMRAFGQKYGLIGFSAQLNLKNRYIPSFEFGLGNADYTPDDNNYTFHAPICPYFKIGMDYNFMYNSNPDYLAFAGIRYGFAPFKYQLKDISLGSDYWGENELTDFPEESFTAGWIELSFGIRAKIIQNVSLGWTFKYHRKIHSSTKESGEPYYIPGYGTSASNIAASFSIYYTLPLAGKKKAKAMSTGDIDLPPEAIPLSDEDSTDEDEHPAPDVDKPDIASQSNNIEPNT